MSKAKIAILVGSDSDVVTMQVGTKILKELKIPYEFHIYSAHRTPKETLQFSQSAQKRGISVIIAGAGMAAHLAGVIASHGTAGFFVCTTGEAGQAIPDDVALEAGEERHCFSYASSGDWSSHGRKASRVGCIVIDGSNA